MQIHNKALPWYIASARKQFVTWFCLPMIFGEAFWTTWQDVYRYNYPE